MSYIGNSPGVASQRVTTTITATAGQTQFTAQSGYVLGYVDVYLNGAKLVNGSDFEAITGTYITLFAGALVGDVVELVSYVPRGLSDGYTKAEADAKFLDVGGDTATGTLALAAASLTGNLTLSGGTANGIGYLNASKVLTTGSSFTYDGSAFWIGSSSLSTDSLNTAGFRFGSGTFKQQFSAGFDYQQFYTSAGQAAPDASVVVGSGYYALKIAGNEQVRLTATGLGIGTSSPSYKLDVNGVARAQNRFIVGPAVDSADRMFYVSGTAPTSGTNQFGAVVNPTLPNTVTGSAYGFYTNLNVANGASVTNAYGLYVDAMSYGTSTITNKFGLYVADTNNSYIAGNLGVGTSSPAYKLDVNGSANFAASVYHRVGGSPFFAASGGYNYFYNNSLGTIWRNSADTAEYMRIDPTGNVCIGISSAYTGTWGTAKLNIGGSIVASDNSATSGSLILAAQYGAGLLATFGSEYSSGGAVMAYGMKPSSSAASAFINTYSGGGALSRSAVTVNGDIRFYTATGATLNVGDAVTISERARITSAGTLVLGHNAGWGYTSDVGSIVLSNGGSDTPNIQFATGTNKNWGIDSWNNSTTQATQYLRFVKDINETGGFMAVTLSPIGSLGLGGIIPSSGVGVAFPASQNASSDVNTLDDYEEGTWTPVLSTESGTNYTLGTPTCSYTKIGNTVTIVAEIPYTAQGSGTITMLSLPFTPSNTRYTLSGQVSGTSNANNRTAIQWIHYSSNMCLVKLAGVDQNYWANKSNFPSTGSFWITGTYVTST